MTYYFSTHLAAYRAACQRVESLESSLRIYRGTNATNGHKLATARVAEQLDDAILVKDRLLADLRLLGVPGF